MKWRWWTAAALGVYGLWSVILIAQRPGLQYDEALLTAGAVAMRHPALLPVLPKHPDTWTCHHNICLPLMAEDRYIGAVKEYLSVPFFALLGNKASTVRLESVLMALIGLWGIAKFLNEQAGPPLGAAVALVLAVNPSFLNMTVFDNGAVAATMAALGLGCAALSSYLLKRTPWAAFWLGAAAGFGIWTRANFIWTLAAAGIAIVLVLRRQVIPPLRHVGSLVLGGIVGGFPFLWYQAVSHGGTFAAYDTFRISDSWPAIWFVRSFQLSEALLVDEEHRVIWGLAEMPAWQLWLFPLIVAAACVIAIVFRKNKMERWPVAQAVSCAFLLLVAFLFGSRLQIAEHHLIAAVPLAAAVVVLAGAIVQQRLARGWMITAAVAAIYGASALYWDFRTVQGLRATGGTGVWSDAISQLTVELQAMEAGRATKVLDWGLFEGLFVLSDGAIGGVEVFAPEAPERSSLGRSWAEEIREGGLFVMSGEGNRGFPAPTAEFLKALSETNPVIEHRKIIAERSGASYAQILDIRPNSIGQGSAGTLSRKIKIALEDPKTEKLTGFYAPEAAGWRWTTRRFGATLSSVDAYGGTPWLVLEGFVPGSNIKNLGPITLTGKVGSNRLPPETYSKEGTFSYSRRLNPDWFSGGAATLEFELDKWNAPSAQDSRELGIVVNSISIEVR